ncbi:hypothetical protein FACS1894216_11430 [Synergistales bacterium]|nr:hypothetical protein FACS1894216_11430 [Synergistales bacterium]
MENSKNTILIVDDENTNLLTLNKILSPEHSVCFAKSGGEAFSLIARNRPDLILLDVIMPDMSGFDVLLKLKNDPATIGIPVIFITGLSDDRDEERGFLFGAVDYIKKPFSGAIVKARINTHMQIVRQMREYEELGRIDPLTGIANRRRFDEHIEAEWKRAAREKKPISILMIDIDKFKNYNDTYGHPQGDALLKAIAKIFTAAARRPGDLSARLGGEEFCVLLPGADLTNALSIAEIIRSNVEAARVPTADGNTQTSVTVSIGAASFLPKPGDDSAALVTKADDNLYAAKKSGRNKICS